MAIYDYKCKSCGASVSIARGIADKEEVPICSACKIPYNRVYSNIGVAFKGGGFYSTDK